MRLHVPLHDLWWLIARASGVVALVLVSSAVVLGLAMAAKTLHGPARRRTAMRLHEDLAVIALVAIAVHGLSLLGDPWLKPGFSGIVVPFSMSYRPAFTGLGIVAGELALLLGPSFYLRRLIRARRWRRVHRLTPVVWVLAVIHTLGSGSDAGAVWLRVVVLAPLPVLAYLLIVRLLATGSRPATGAVSAHVTVAAGRRSAGRRPAGRRRVAGQLEAKSGSVPG